MRIPAITFLIVFTFSLTAMAAHGRALYPNEIERLKALKELLHDVDTKSLRQSIIELERSKDPLIDLEMKEAMARAYADIVKEMDVQGQHKKEWLYSMICLNMAYLQFGGDEGKRGSTTELNRLIRKKLIGYLPAGVLKQPGFFYSLQ